MIELYEKILEHIGHKIVCVKHGDYTVAFECETCGRLIIDVDKPDWLVLAIEMKAAADRQPEGELKDALRAKADHFLSRHEKDIMNED